MGRRAAAKKAKYSEGSDNYDEPPPPTTEPAGNSDGPLEGTASFAGVLNHSLEESAAGPVEEGSDIGNVGAISNKRKRAKKDEEEAEEQTGPSLSEANVLFGADLENALRELKESSDALSQVVLQAQREDVVGEKNRALLVQYWLVENYMYDYQSNSYVFKSDIHKNYSKFCEKHAIDPFSLSTFGKILYTVFPGVKPRRLGGRENQKYSYHGLIAKQKLKPKVSEELDSSVPDRFRLPQIAEPKLEGAEAFCKSYYEFLHQIWVSVQHLKIINIENALKKFWTGLTPEQLKLVAESPMVAWICEMDGLLYESILAHVIPNVLHDLPAAVLASIRQLGRMFLPWNASAMEHVSPALTEEKLALTKVFVMQIARYTSLNALANAAGNLLRSPDILKQATRNWNAIDFSLVRDQASWVMSECDMLEVSRIAQVDISRFLQTEAATKLEAFALTLDQIVQRLVFTDGNNTKEGLMNASRKFLLNWHYYQTLLSRELLLKSASTFGNFQVLFAFANEYLAFVIEDRISSLE